MMSLSERYRSARRDSSLAVLEGLHALKHALRFEAEILDVRTANADALRELAEQLAPDVAGEIAARAEPTDPDEFATLAPSPHPTGVIALARRTVPPLEPLLAVTDPAPIVLLERPTHHGNVGAVVRVAAAAGAAGVLVTGRHDPWHPAAIRGAAGLQFALPVIPLDAEGVAVVLAAGRAIVALDPEGAALTPAAAQPGADPARSGSIPPRAVLVFGSERSGVSEALRERADVRIRIPMRPGVSSLNLATAVAVALYAAGGSAPS